LADVGGLERDELRAAFRQLQAVAFLVGGRGRVLVVGGFSDGAVAAGEDGSGEDREEDEDRFHW